MEKRIKKWDILRILLVIMVVLGHSTYLKIDTNFGGIDYLQYLEESDNFPTKFYSVVENITNSIYLFHMPVFIFLSGVMFKRALDNRKYDKFKYLVKDKFLKLIVPLIFVWTIWNIPIKYFSNYYQGISTLDMYIQIIFSSNVYLWFLEALFFSFLINWFIVKKVKSRLIQNILVIVMFIYGCILELIVGKNMPLGNPLYYQLWLYIGINWDSIQSKLDKFVLTKYIFLFIDAVLIASNVIIYNLKIFMDLDEVMQILIILSKFIIPFISIYLLSKLSEFIEKVINIKDNTIKEISKYLFGIYLYAEPLNYLVLKIYYDIFGKYIFVSEIGSMILYFSRIGFSVLIAMIVVKILERYKLKYLY